MDWTTFMQDVCLTLVPVLGLFVCTALHSVSNYFVEKTADTTAQQHIREIEKAVTKSVRVVAQTYTDELKKAGTFDEPAQKIASRRAIEAARNSLSADALNYIAKTSGDVDSYLLNYIEAALNEIKNEKLNTN